MGENVPIPSDADGGTGPSPYAGNSTKVAYMELMMNQRIGTIELETFPAKEQVVWHGIKQFVVPVDKRPAFDAGFVPSVLSRKQNPSLGSWKTPLAAWRRMGFTEVVHPDGSILFQYCQITFDQMQQTYQKADHKRKRRMGQPAESPPALDAIVVPARPGPKKRKPASATPAELAALAAVAAEQRAIAIELQAATALTVSVPRLIN